jgi:uncharacterized membrane protein YfcA
MKNIVSCLFLSWLSQLVLGPLYTGESIITIFRDINLEMSFLMLIIALIGTLIGCPASYIAPKQTRLIIGILLSCLASNLIMFEFINICYSR